MNIRLLKPTDYDEIYALWLTEHMGLNSVDDTREGIERFIRRNPATSFVAEADGKIVGTMLCGHDGRNGYIYHACVLREYQNQKIGTRLAETVFDALKTEGISQVKLTLYSDNDAGNRFWERMGFNEKDFLRFKSKALVKLEYKDSDGSKK